MNSNSLFLLIIQNINFKKPQKIYFFYHVICAETVIIEKGDKWTRESSSVYPLFLFMGICWLHFSGVAAGKQKYFFNHISIAEKTITGKQAINWSFQRQGFFLRNNAPARELDVCRPSVFTNLFFIQTYKSFFRKHEQNADNG